MNDNKNEKIGKFICEQRRNKHLTQKELADQLGVTDKAVSKWERGLSYPDISLLCTLSDILGITTGQLLNGEKSQDSSPEVESIIETTLHYADTATKSKSKDLRKMCAVIYTVLSLIGIITCTICNFAVSGGLTWALYPISSILYGWALIFPLLYCNKKGVLISLLLLTVLTVPFLYVLERIVGTDGLIMPIGIRSSAVGLLYLWFIYLVFSIKKLRKYVAAAIVVMLGIPINVWINTMVSRLLGEIRLIDIWDILSYSILALTSITIFLFGYMHSKKLTHPASSNEGH